MCLSLENFGDRWERRETNAIVDGISKVLEYAYGFSMNLSPHEQILCEALQELADAVASLKTSTNKPDLRRLLDRVDHLGLQLKPDPDVDLRHYLHRKSYEKAVLHLSQRQPEISRGSCGRGAP